MKNKFCLLLVLSPIALSNCTPNQNTGYENRPTTFLDAFKEMKNSNLKIDGIINKTILNLDYSNYSKTISRNIDLEYSNNLLRKNDDFYKIGNNEVLQGFLNNNLDIEWNPVDYNSRLILNPFNKFKDENVSSSLVMGKVNNNYIDYSSIAASPTFAIFASMLLDVIEQYFLIDSYSLYNFSDNQQILKFYFDDSDYFKITSVDFNFVFYYLDDISNTTYLANYSGALNLNYGSSLLPINENNPFSEKVLKRKRLTDVFSSLTNYDYGYTLKITGSEPIINQFNLEDINGYITKDLVYFKFLESNEEIILKRQNDIAYLASFNGDGSLSLNSPYLIENQLIIFDELLPYKNYDFELFNLSSNLNWGLNGIYYEYLEDFQGNEQKALNYLFAISPISIYDNLIKYCLNNLESYKLNYASCIFYNNTKTNYLDNLLFFVNEVFYYFTFDKGENLPINLKNYLFKS